MTKTLEAQDGDRFTITLDFGFDVLIQYRRGCVRVVQERAVSPWTADDADYHLSISQFDVPRRVVCDILARWGYKFEETPAEPGANLPVVTARFGVQNVDNGRVAAFETYAEAEASLRFIQQHQKAVRQQHADYVESGYRIVRLSQSAEPGANAL